MENNKLISYSYKNRNPNIHYNYDTEYGQKLIDNDPIILSDGEGLQVGKGLLLGKACGCIHFQKN